MHGRAPGRPCGCARRRRACPRAWPSRPARPRARCRASKGGYGSKGAHTWSAMRMCSASMRMSSGVAIATSATARSLPNVLYAQERIERMNFTAAMPLFATSTLRAGSRRPSRGQPAARPPALPPPRCAPALHARHGAVWSGLQCPCPPPQCAAAPLNNRTLLAPAWCAPAARRARAKRALWHWYGGPGRALQQLHEAPTPWVPQGPYAAARAQAAARPTAQLCYAVHAPAGLLRCHSAEAAPLPTGDLQASRQRPVLSSDTWKPRVPGPHLWMAFAPPSSRHLPSTCVFRLGTRLGTPIFRGLLPCLRTAQGSLEGPHATQDQPLSLLVLQAVQLAYRYTFLLHFLRAAAHPANHIGLPRACQPKPKLNQETPGTRHSL